MKAAVHCIMLYAMVQYNSPIQYAYIWLSICRHQWQGVFTWAGMKGISITNKWCFHLQSHLWNIFWMVYNSIIGFYLLYDGKHSRKKDTCDKMHSINSLCPGRFDWNFKPVILKLILVRDVWGTSMKLPQWLSLDLNGDKTKLVQVMAWCHQATSHYLNQYWHRSMSTYIVTRPQWVNQRTNNMFKHSICQPLCL